MGGEIQLLIGQRVSLPGHFDTDEMLRWFGELRQTGRCARTRPAAALGLVKHHLEQDTQGFAVEGIERVGHLKYGFDIRAHRVCDTTTGEIEVMRIEVKGRMRGQPVRLSTNEWYKAQQLATTYWLCVVWDPLSETPEMVAIQNPAEKLDHAKRSVLAGRFFEITADAIGRVGDAVNDSTRAPQPA